jgi:hypothetical protein
VIVPDSPTLVAGATDAVWVKITDRNKQDLTGVTVQLRTVDPDGLASAWAAPYDDDTSEATVGVLRAALLHTAGSVGLWEVQAKLTVGPLSPIVPAGSFRVVA